jgi:hypothetical protein
MQEKLTVLFALGEIQQLLRHCMCLLELPAPEIKPKQSPQATEQLSGFTHLLTQLPRSGISSFHLWGGKAFDGSARHAEQELQVQLSPSALRGIWEGLQESQSLREVTDRLHMGRPLHSLSAS